MSKLSQRAAIFLFARRWCLLQFLPGVTNERSAKAGVRGRNLLISPVDARNDAVFIVVSP